jgi:alpha-aminoadipic semialdehyde synthase
MNSLLIRAEDKNMWERRATIVPDDLKDITAISGVKSYIQKSAKRYFKVEEYKTAGAQEVDDMTLGDVIFGVKEIPVEKILSDKTYLFFSHTIKGQTENMPLLKTILRSKSTLIDYEKITDKDGKRLVYFGPYAGDAGAIDLLWLMGNYWKNKGVVTPFAEVKQALEYRSVSHAKEELLRIGKQIETDGLASEISPLVIGILGYGNVSKGAQGIFNCLPVEYIKADKLKNFIESGNYSNKKVYIVLFEERHIVKRKDGEGFELQDYFQYPENYENNFEQYLPYLTLLVNAVYWEKSYPKFVTWENLNRLFTQTKNVKLSGIADITCDVGGSIECNVKTTDSGEPAYLVNPITKEIKDGVEGEGIVLLAVDNLPAELPADSSTFFSNLLKPFIPDILKADFSQPFDKLELPSEVKRAVIAHRGQLTPTFEYLEKFIK